MLRQNFKPLEPAVPDEGASVGYEVAIVWLALLLIIVLLAGRVGLSGAGAADADLIGPEPAAWAGFGA
jgi:hypothetical protein